MYNPSLPNLTQPNPTKPNPTQPNQTQPIQTKLNQSRNHRKQITSTLDLVQLRIYQQNKKFKQLKTVVFN